MTSKIKHILVIPARYESTRLPGKPLVDLCGLPMIVRTYRQCEKAFPAEDIYIATDDDRIADVCRQYGIKHLITSSDCLTGTDRVAEVSRKISADVYINIQGDEPLFNPADIRKLVEESNTHPKSIINGYCSIGSEQQFRSTSIPKVVIRPDGQLLYMSRAAIPVNKQGSFTSAYRQVCAYAYPKSALDSFSAAKTKTPLERIEDIELLRFLEMGYDVRMISMSVESIAIDLPEDVIEVVERLKVMEVH